MAKRYHYDAKGRLKGYSSDKYIPRFRDLVIIFGIIAAIGLLRGQDKSKDGGKAAATSTAIDPRPTFSASAGRNDADRRTPTKDRPRSLEDEGYNAKAPQVENPSGFERDLKPYYEAECAKGDQSACDTLAKSK